MKFLGETQRLLRPWKSRTKLSTCASHSGSLEVRESGSSRSPGRHSGRSAFEGVLLLLGLMDVLLLREEAEGLRQPRSLPVNTGHHTALLVPLTTGGMCTSRRWTRALPPPMDLRECRMRATCWPLPMYSHVRCRGLCAQHSHRPCTRVISAPPPSPRDMEKAGLCLRRSPRAPGVGLPGASPGQRNSMRSSCGRCLATIRRSSVSDRRWYSSLPSWCTMLHRVRRADEASGCLNAFATKPSSANPFSSSSTASKACSSKEASNAFTGGSPHMASR
mmetsp:Transcript_80660/g.250345  ORF Transcript_80660/g.250345 Transcript_80660/m.250345 type:complete len:276 (+) Transcript_80660:386-1213(+)